MIQLTTPPSHPLVSASVLSADFGCMADDTINSVITQTQRQQIIVIGIETHVCISQTVHDLLARGL